MLQVRSESLRNALQFMERSNLVGKEVLAYNDAYQAIVSVIQSLEKPRSSELEKDNAC
jgi:hypothetical protein